MPTVGASTTARTEEVEQRREQLPRAPTVGALGDAGAIAEATRILTDKHGYSVFSPG